ncbi:hypothetical protein N657DRAFT_633195 [Parathielavia appendiculata]|uniref:Shadow of prion protein n=1 Tax=Parathielavia appendiculata TaxID=2587402 RepID=A0AAN6U2N8_9PEZI|nr:hypothetical protein N657DRAFT_633195 [Parathielavia appendiculata]
MHGRLAISAALVGLLAQVSATTCTSANATPIEQYIGSGSGGGGGGGNGGFVISQDPFAWVSNAVKKRTTPDARLANVANILLPRATDSVDCSATEACLSISSTPFCLDIISGDFHDGVGTTGNALSGDYTLADGRKGNLYKGPYPQVTVGAANAATTVASSASHASETAGGTSGASETASAGGGAGATRSGSGVSTPTATGVAPAATTSKSAAVHGKVAAIGMGGAMLLVGAVLL